MTNNEYVFDNKKDIVAYVCHMLKNVTPIKLQKSLYFLWGFYAATYGNIDYSAKSELKDEEQYPKYLFEPAFEAWKYGPADNKVFAWDKSNQIETFDNNFEVNTPQKKDIDLFMRDLLKQIDSVNDFGLVSRSHQDKAYKSVYKPNSQHLRMDPAQIKSDYVGYVNEQSKI